MTSLKSYAVLAVSFSAISGTVLGGGITNFI